MKRALTLLIAAAMLVSLAGAAMATPNPADYSPAKIKLTVHQERFLMETMQCGTDRILLPLTHRQQAYLEQAWPGWSGAMLTVFPADMLDSDGTIYVVPTF